MQLPSSSTNSFLSLSLKQRTHGEVKHTRLLPTAFYGREVVPPIDANRAKRGIPADARPDSLPQRGEAIIKGEDSTTPSLADVVEYRKPQPDGLAQGVEKFRVEDEHIEGPYDVAFVIYGAGHAKLEPPHRLDTPHIVFF